MPYAAALTVLVRDGWDGQSAEKKSQAQMGRGLGLDKHTSSSGALGDVNQNQGSTPHPIRIDLQLARRRGEWQPE